MTTTTVQLDLFTDITPTDQEGRGEDRETWAARFERAEWVSPYEPTIRSKGWVCPCCGDVEPNIALLANNHGIDPDVPADGFPAECIAEFLRRNNATWTARVASAVERCVAAGHAARRACDECWNATRGAAV